jgi:hypothetical protein
MHYIYIAKFSYCQAGIQNPASLCLTLYIFILDHYYQ